MADQFQFYNSTVGRKIIMSLTGLGFLGFVVSHLLANFLLFVSPQAYNEYSHLLISNPLIYFAEAVLVVLFFTHAVLALILTRNSQQARKQAYAMSKSKQGPSRRTLSSSTMYYSGIVVLLFVIIHVWTVKFGKFYAVESDGEEIRDLYRLVAEMFMNPWVVLGYGAAVLVLGIHLFHAFSSAFQTLGVNRPKLNKILLCLGQFLALFIALGFLAMPLYFYIKGGA